MEGDEAPVKKYLSFVSFICMLGVVTVWSLVNPKQEYSDMENRNLQQFPVLSFSNIMDGTFQNQYESYLSDQMFCRDQWVDVYSRLEQLSGKQEINNVYLGRDYYLIEKYTENEFDKDLQKANIDILSNFLDNISAHFGEKHVSCLFVPSKIDVLKNKLPCFAEEYDGNEVVEQIKAEVRNKNRVQNLADALSQHKDEYIYYRTDHHWTTLGAYYGFCEYERMNAQKVPELKDYEQELVFDDFFGTTYNKAHTFVKPDEVHIFHTDYENVKVNGNNGEFKSDSFYFHEAAKDSFDRYQLFMSKNTGKIEVTTSGKKGRTLLLIKDSYANCFVPFLANEYSKIIMIDCRYTKAKMKHILKQYTDITDVLVLFNIEKFRKDTHLASLEISEEDLRKTEEDKKDVEEEEHDIFADLISLD